MKAPPLLPAAAAKRRMGPRVAVLALVLCSLLVPFTFLFDRSPSGYVTTEERHRQEVVLPSFEHVEERAGRGAVGGVRQDAPKKIPKGSAGGIQHHKQIDHHLSSGRAKPKVLPSPKVKPSKAVTESTRGTREVGKDINGRQKGAKADEVEKAKACQLEFGSYCLWSIEHKEVMKDSIVKRLKDQLFVARSYYPSIAKLQGQEALTQEMKQNIQNHERVLSVSTVDADLPSFINKRIEQMEQTIVRAKSCTVDCNNVDRKLRQILDMTEDEAHFHMKQSAFLYNLGAQTLPKSHHCLSMRLTLEYFKSSSLNSDDSPSRKFSDPKYRHYVILSKNILAASVVINSTVSSCKEPDNLAFHILTDAQNFYAMKHWFARNSYKKAALHIINYEGVILEKLPKYSIRQLYLPEEFRFLIRSIKQPTENTRMEYLSLFSHSHFLIPKIFKNLNKVVVLDDDVVVQRDLSFLWNIDMGDKVNGAIKFCGLKLGQVRNLFGKTAYDPKSCAWMSGVNLINLDKWREHNVTENYLLLMKKFKYKDEESLRAAAFPLSLLSFQHLIYPLDEKLTLAGLGYDYGIDEEIAQRSASLHYNGNMKPWLELGIPDYKEYWRRFLIQGDRFMEECNVNP
ncbi:probable galacturonosyltransferase 7 [Phragmites australis]|uniref:probable galacturonosyltransferase 7 n=1 Tax=Phragmites australis TaxID=29695 RepID=UPI002D78A598|nr:probable galacturonosyltransferase 7 [Phragmites australis]